MGSIIRADQFALFVKNIHIEKPSKQFRKMRIIGILNIKGQI